MSGYRFACSMLGATALWCGSASASHSQTLSKSPISWPRGQPTPGAGRTPDVRVGAFSAGLVAGPAGRGAARGALVGVLLGGGLGLLIGYVTCDACDEPTPVLAAGATGAAVGAIVGAVIGAHRGS